MTCVSSVLNRILVQLVNKFIVSEVLPNHAQTMLKNMWTSYGKRWQIISQYICNVRIRNKVQEYLNKNWNLVQVFVLTFICIIGKITWKDECKHNVQSCTITGTNKIRTNAHSTGLSHLLAGVRALRGYGGPYTIRRACRGSVRAMLPASLGGRVPPPFDSQQHQQQQLARTHSATLGGTQPADSPLLPDWALWHCAK